MVILELTIKSATVFLTGSSGRYTYVCCPFSIYKVTQYKNIIKFNEEAYSVSFLF
ncbi:Uncharacterised protein [Staphylococcus caeli]|uniref:Uncharacterized protein n=1 Tax=Staphylococcus caeli TaxID=2201815 RepID=A0A1D4JKM4_9STAP|nr:Uncharacterised protein [Staphylococcus caeli]SCS62051.1 Uncharacterised protein [Staphylococcus caeli]